MNQECTPKGHGKGDGKGNGDGTSGSGPGGGPGYTPWLLVRYQVGDMGARPLPSGTVFWESPDIWTQGSMGMNHPVVGEPTQVYGQVTNFGAQGTSTAMITYWWANPSMAITTATANAIGTASMLSIPSMNMLPFLCPQTWTPVEENGGHECLLIEAFVPVFDPLIDPMQPVYDRHVGQKNEYLVQLMRGQSMHFQLDSFNFSREEQEIAVEAVRGEVSHNLIGRLEAARGYRGASPAYVAGHHEVIPTLDVAAKAARHVTHAAGHADRLLSQTAPGAHHLGKPLASVTRRFAPGSIHKVEIAATLPAHARPGELYSLRIFQRIGDTITGGYTIYMTLAG